MAGSHVGKDSSRSRHRLELVDVADIDSKSNGDEPSVEIERVDWWEMGLRILIVEGEGIMLRPGTGEKGKRSCRFEL